LLTGKTFEATAMLLSFLVLGASYLLIAWKDRSWINWATPFFFLAVGARYIFPFLYLYLIRSPGGSHYAYFFCYTTYALSFLTGALVYTFVKPFKIRHLSSNSTHGVGIFPWLLLFLGFLLYLPVLVEFRAYLATPRKIYELTRTGYGIWFFGSTFFATLGFVTYLFQKGKSLIGVLTFCVLCGALTYWHGSKGQILNYVLIWMLYRVYVDRKSIRALTALAVLLGTGALVIGSFALFSNTGDMIALVDSVTGYADSVRNAMEVIDDQQGKRYYGQLAIEDEVYSRIPRAIMPGKPMAYGSFRLARTYSPASYRNNEGTSAFDIGVRYADFGPFSMILLCLSSGGIAWLLSSLVFHLRRQPTSGTFLIFIFLAGVNVIPISGVFFLPEMILLASALSFALRFRLIRGGLKFGHAKLPGGAT